MKTILSFVEKHDLERSCEDLIAIAQRVYEGSPRKTDAALIDDLLEIIQGAAGLVKRASKDAFDLQRHLDTDTEPVSPSGESHRARSETRGYKPVTPETLDRFRQAVARLDESIERWRSVHQSMLKDCSEHRSN